MDYLLVYHQTLFDHKVQEAVSKFGKRCSGHEQLRASIGTLELTEEETTYHTLKLLIYLWNRLK